MGTYSNPASQKSISSIRPSTNSSSVDQGLAAMITSRQNAIAANEKRNETNWKLRQKALAEVGTANQTLIDAGKANKLNMESLNVASKKIMKDYANTKIRLAQATSKYDGYEKDEAFVRNTKLMLDNITNTFGTMNYTVDKYNETLNSKGAGTGAGQVNMSSVDSRFLAMMGISKPGNGISGEISWDADYDEENGWTWKQVARGESIRQANLSKGIDSDVYEMSYKANADFEDNEDNSDYNNFVYNTVPEVLDKDTIETLADLKVIDKKGKILDDYKIDGTETRNGEVFKTQSTNVRELYGRVKVAADAKVAGISAGTDDVVASSMRAYVGKGLEEETIKGKKQFVYYKPSYNTNGTLKRNADGTMLKESSNKVVLGDDKLGGGQFIRQDIEENAQRFGFNEEQFKEFSEWAQYQTAYELGAFTQDKGKIDVGATNRLRDDKAAAIKRNKANKGKGNTKSLIDKTSLAVTELLDLGDLEGAVIAVQDLAGLKSGYSIQTPDHSNPAMINVIGPESVSGKDARKLPLIDITSRSGLQNLYNLFGEESLVPGVSSKLTEAQKKEDLNYRASEYIKEYNKETGKYTPRPTDEDDFQESFTQEELSALGIKELRIPNNFNNEINVIGIDGKSLGTFDPKTDKGKWEEIVRKQLSKSPEETPKESPKEDNGIDGYE
jgi:hypothetical protein